ncbi:hypothetical protein FQN54_006311 [Arachnomyces sp. PD_36]|nr:hypothetical protein FQN54_006311 [Arachnomyces sp. PD_36]
MARLKKNSKKPAPRPKGPGRICSLPVELLWELPKHGLSRKDVYNLLKCNRFFSRVFAPCLHKYAIEDRDRGQTALIWALKNRKVPLVRYLLSTNHNEVDPLHRWHPLEVAFSQGNLEFIYMLLEHLHKAFPNDYTTFALEASSALFCFVHYLGNYTFEVVNMLLDLGADPDGADPLKYKPPGIDKVQRVPENRLLFDIKDPDIMALLISRGADVGACTGLLEKTIDSPLRHGNVDVLLWYVKDWKAEEYEEMFGQPMLAAARGPYPNIADKLLTFGYEEGIHTVAPFDSPLHIAAESKDEGKAIMFMTLLLDKGADPDQRDVGDCPTPMLKAVYHGNWRTAIFLRSRGAEYRSQTLRGQNIFHLAVEAEKPDNLFFEFMLRHCRHFVYQGNRKDARGETAYEIMYRRAHRDFLERGKIGSKLKGGFYCLLKKLRNTGFQMRGPYEWLWLQAHPELKRFQPYRLRRWEYHY